MSNKYPGGFVSLGGQVPSNSNYFDGGTSTRLAITSNAAFAFGTGAYTVEAWVYATSFAATQGTIFDAGLATGSFDVTLKANGGVSLGAYGGGGSTVTTAASAVSLNSWTHVAAVRDSTSSNATRIYINGVLSVTGTDANNYTVVTSPSVGGLGIGGGYTFIGYISNLRVVKGTALYTNSFPPPLGPATNVSGTSLLTCQSPTFVDNSSNGFTVTSTGVTISTLQPNFQAYNPNNLDPALGAATPGVWTLSQALAAEVTRSWPMYDPYYKNVVLNLHGNGTNAAQNNTFLDSSSNGYSLTRGGSLTQGSFSPYGQGWSNYFSGSGSTFIYATNTAALQPSSSDFTFECWFYGTATTYIGTLYSYGNPGVYAPFNVYATSTGYLSVPISTTGSSWNIEPDADISGSAWVLNTWNHVAVCRSGTTIRVFLNGVVVRTTTGVSGALYTPTENLKCGSRNGSEQFTGYISNWRWVVGSALYTSNFTPSTTPLTAVANTKILWCSTNALQDATNVYPTLVSGTPSVQRFSPFLFNTSYTPSSLGGSAYNPGAANLTTSYSGSVGSTDDFTVEGWFYVTANTDNGSFVLCAAALGIIMTQSGQKLSTYIPSVGFIAWQSTALVQNTWHYIVVQRSASTMSCYLNGTRLGTQAGATGGWTYNGAGLYLTGSSSNREAGYYTDVRISTIARYSGSTMTVPTAPLTSDANTTFLLSMTNAGIYDNAATTMLQTVGGAQISTSTVKYGTGSIYLPSASSSYCITPSTTNFAFGTGDFTIEFWWNGNVAGSGGPILWFGSTWQMYCDTNVMAWQSSVGVSNKWTVSISINTGWNHVAIVRVSGVFKVFINGVSQSAASGTFTDSTAFSAAAQLRIGLRSDTVYTNGYIDDLRITNGVARYIGNFTPPTSQLQDQ